ncbi:MAG: GntR family transcriptional regulator [Lachnospiraceae bacterium]|nr:GntR family transcriptional regulator [Lachnospiraceae bacterium]
MKIILSNQSEKPIYLQIKEQLEEQILSGEVREDTVLPSIRKMAADLKVSVITTTRAYKELETDGFITTVPGKGCIVLAPDNQILREQYLRRMEDGFMQAKTAAKKLQMPLAEAQEIFETIWKI